VKKILPALSALVLVFEVLAAAQSPHPWLDQQLKKQRYPCPPGKSPFRGPADAAVTVVEFADFDCPYCRSDEAAIKRVLAAHPTQVKLVFKSLPLDIHSAAKQKAHWNSGPVRGGSRPVAGWRAGG
jgi:protein-disulfide isomerase